MRPETMAAIEQARINIRAHPDLKFYYPATLHLNPVPAALMEQQLNVSFSLAAVDRNGNLGLHEDEFLALDELQRTGLILHEAMHCAHNHVVRQEYLNPKWANIAADVLINSVIQDGFMPIPDGGVTVASIKTQLGIEIPEPPWEHSMEEIYAMFPVDDEPPEDLSNQGSMVPGALPSPENSETPDLDQDDPPTPDGQGQHQPDGGNQPPKDLGSWLGELIGQEAPDWEAVLAECQDFAQGHEPLGAPRAAPPAPVQDDAVSHLYHWSGALPGVELSYARPNRRRMYLYGAGIIPPGRTFSKPRIRVFVDTSGSINQEVLSEYQGHFRAVQDWLQAEIELYAGDTQVQDVITIQPGDEWPELHGGGGSDFRPFFEMSEEDSPPDGILILTDGWIAWPETPPICKCLTLTTGRDCPFGESVKIGV